MHHQTTIEVANQSKLTTLSSSSSSSFNTSNDLPKIKLNYMNQETMLDNTQFEIESTVAHIAQASPITVFIY